MKSSLYILVFFLLAINCYSQKTTIPKKANRIEVAATLSDSALFDMISFRLESAGFFIDQSDRGKGYLTTEYKNMGSEISIKVIVHVQGNIAVFSGQGNADLLGYRYTNTPLVYKGSSGGVEKGGFMALDGVVKKLYKTIGASSIKYLTPEPSEP